MIKRVDVYEKKVAQFFEQSRAEQSRAAGSSQPIALRLWLAFLGEPRMGAVTQIKDLDSAPSRAWADCALFSYKTTYICDG